MNSNTKIFIGDIAIGIEKDAATLGIKQEDGSYLTTVIDSDEVRLLTNALRTVNDIAVLGD
ncbi:hypothetical protein MHK03_06095 [Corynebacterium simulans]|uniref:hypothetical protein n=1 Tax=Corynebacterium simulans TaxID=146827 RepID=UPI001EF2A5F2|nr:hypothetical protein [Corynebacterium simulans]MCG7247495.1 hypothetical protein [Corynebacterium simulans]